MYRKTQRAQISFEDFVLPFSGQLSRDNRWVKLAELMPWDEIEEKYASLFTSKTGNVAKPARMAIGSLIIKEKQNYTDQETVEQITENPYLQYFIGLKEFSTETPFDPSLMTYFRKRVTPEMLKEINEMIYKDNDKKAPTGGDKDNPNTGKLILDATVAPADIRYPTDLSLLNEAREKSEKIIDILYQDLPGIIDKPRTYRQKARNQYLSLAKQKKAKKKKIRNGIKKQLGYLKRNLKSINFLLLLYPENPLTIKQQETLAVIQELYRQQQHMYDNNIHTVENRIVSISQPHVRPIVRGKAGTSTEFGAKLAISLVNGFAFLDILQWVNFNEGTTLKESVERYKERYGCYPEVVIADKIYRNRENISYCKELGIRISGSKLGRKNEEIKAKEKAIAKADGKERNAVEGKIGEGKRRYGLDLIMARLRETSETEINLQFLVMNLEHCLRIHFVLFSRTIFSLFKEHDLAPKEQKFALAA